MLQLRENRTLRGISRAQLAVQLGVSPDTIGRWERGDRKPNYDYVLRMAEIFQMPPSELMGSQIEAVQEIDSGYQRAISQLSDPEKLAIFNMLDGLSKEKVRKVSAYISDQKHLDDLEKLQKGA